MIFGKKRKMIDVRELQKRGVVRIPKREVQVNTNDEGFVDLNTSSNTTDFDFNSPTENSKEGTYTKREIDEKIINLDNKIYKIEQRLELIERKLGISDVSIQGNTNSSGSLIGW